MKDKKSLIIKISLFNLVLIVICILLNKMSLLGNIIKYINLDKSISQNFKDLLSIAATIMAVFIGFIATAATVLMSMCDRRVMKIISRMSKLDIIIQSLKNSLKFGIVCLFCIGILYTNFDFNIMLIKYALIWCMLNSLFIFSYESRFLIGLVKNVTLDAFLNNESTTIRTDLTIKK